MDQFLTELEKAGIHAVVIGKVTEGKDRVIRKDEEEHSFLERPKTDELYNIYA